MFALGWLTYTTFRLFINRDFSIKNIFMLVLCFYLLALIKVYILMAFLPAIGLWIFMKYSYKIRNTGARWLVNLLSIGAVVGLFFYFAGVFANELNKYSLENIAKTAEVTRGWINYASGDEGSAYDLGDFDPTLTGMLSKAPLAIFTTLYRPFIWESRKVIVLFSAIEVLIFLYFTLKIVGRHKGKIFSFIRKDANLIFCLVFTLIFAFAVGISSYNFGSLSRYKIPCMPYFGLLLLVLLNYPKNFESYVPVVKRKKLPEHLAA